MSRARRPGPGCGAEQPLLKFLICRVVARRSVRGDATLAGNAVTKSLRAGSREELIRRNNVNATGNGRYWAPPSDKIRLQMLAGAGND